MQCRSCQATLEPDAISCSRCNTSLMTMNDTYDEAAPYTDRIPYVSQKMLAQRTAAVAAVLPATPVPQEQQAQPIEAAPVAPRHTDRVPDWMIALLTLFSLLLIIGGSGFLTYAVAFRPGEFHAQATVVAQNFLTAQAQSAAQANAKATAIADRQTPDQVYQAATSGKPVIDDPLQDASGNVWFSYGSPCRFNASAYHTASTGTGRNYCVGANAYFSDLAFQVQLMNIKNGAGGLVFRLTTQTNQAVSGYLFGVDTQGQYFLMDLNAQEQLTILQRGISPVFTSGLNQTNTLMVIARGSTIYLYVNDQFVSKITNKTYTSGQIGFWGENDTDAFDVAFNNVKVWAL